MNISKQSNTENILPFNILCFHHPLHWSYQRNFAQHFSWTISGQAVTSWRGGGGRYISILFSSLTTGHEYIKTNIVFFIITLKILIRHVKCKTWHQSARFENVWPPFFSNLNNFPSLKVVNCVSGTSSERIFQLIKGSSIVYVGCLPPKNNIQCCLDPESVLV